MKATVKKVNYTSKYAKTIEKEVRSLSYYFREVNKDFEALIVNPSSEAAQKYLAAADKDRIDFAKEVFNSAAFSAENLTIGYLKKWYPFVNVCGQICDVKKIAAEDETSYKQQAAEVKQNCSSESESDKEAAAAKAGLQFIYNKDNVLCRLQPVEIWTANKLLSKIKAAKKAEADAKKQADNLQKELEDAKQRPAKIAALKARLAELEAAEAAAAASAKANKESKQQKAAKAA